MGMLKRQIKFDDDARQSIKIGIDKSANAIKATLGPGGMNVAFDFGFGAPNVTKDGVTVAREIGLEDKYENMGAEFVKEAADKTNTNAGDGTTTTSILLQAIANEGMMAVSNGANAVQLKRQLDSAAKNVLEKLKEMSVPVNDSEAVKQVATISGNDEAVGEIISKVVDEAGMDAIITIEEGDEIGLNYEVVDGLRFDRGLFSPHFITDYKALTADLKNAPILVTEEPITNVDNVVPIVDALMKAGKKELIIIADDAGGAALQTLIHNKLNGVFTAVIIQAPGYGDGRWELLEDIACLTGATVISERLGRKLSEIGIEDLGSASRVVADRYQTTIVDGASDDKVLEARISHIKAELDKTKSKFDQAKLKERLASLSSGVANIKVGAATETEMREIKYRVEDAVNSTQAAIAEGIIPGGGVALALISKNMDEYDQGERILKKALQEPLLQIAKNAGVNESTVLYKVEESNDGKKAVIGYNAGTDEYVDMIKTGIIDPVKVTREAVTNAVSAATMFLTIKAAIIDVPTAVVPKQE
jgi:chaperonin GroEL